MLFVTSHPRAFRARLLISSASAGVSFPLRLARRTRFQKRFDFMLTTIHLLKTKPSEQVRNQTLHTPVLLPVPVLRTRFEEYAVQE